MPRYVVERTFPSQWEVPSTPEGARACRELVDNNTREQVTWVQSFVSTDKKRTYCLYDGPSPEAVRRAATANALPVDVITEVRVLDPYFYHGGAPEPGQGS